MTTPYDECYKRFFSNPEIIKDLLLHIFKEDWVKDLDFSSLEKLDKEYISTKLGKRSNDLIWKVKWQHKTIYLLIMLEFQSSVDNFMALRVLNYVSELYLTLLKIDQDIIKTKKLPPVLPLVLYNGDKIWTAAKNMHELFADDLPKNLLTYQPQISYWLLPELSYQIKDNLEKKSLVGLLLKLEQSKNLTDFIASAKHLTTDSAEIWQDFLLYVKYILRLEEKLSPEELFESQKEANMLHGTLYERARIWEKELIAKGMQQGVQQGVQKGIQKGELAIVKNMLTIKFGRIPAKQLAFLNNLNSKELLDFSTKIFNAKALKDILAVEVQD